MALTPVIPKGRPDHPSLDYEVLRAEGIRHLESLATEIWTDFNAHDPGITLLELLSYAITDLGYRTRKLPIADLLAGDKGKAFFEPVEILPCAPVTARDFRKILIDIDGVKNAWIEKYRDVPLFSEKGSDYGLQASEVFRFREISFLDSTNELWTPVDEKINEFLQTYYGKNEEDEEMSSARRLIHLWIRDGVSKDTCARIGVDPNTIFDACLTPKKCSVPEIDPPKEDEKGNCALLTELLCRYGYTPLSLKKEKDGVQNGQQWLHLNGLAKISIDLDDKINPENESETRPILDQVMKRLQANRFLGHDYVKPLTIVGKLPVSLCLHLEIASGKNIVNAAAEALWQIEQHLTPTLRFHTFKEMLAKGYPIDQIYNGPLLDHGFLDNNELDAAQLLTKFRHSDLINAANNHPDVLSVHELKVKVSSNAQFEVKTTYQIFTPKEEANPNLNPDPKDPTQLPRPLKPVIDLCKSCIYITQNGVRCELQEESLAEALNLKKLLAECHDAPGGFERPTGNFRDDLAEYRSVQYDLPSVYGVGDFGVTDKTPPHKKGARKQLQAYLSFFDQILAAYLLQLSEVRQIFAVEQHPGMETYQKANLSKIPGFSDIVNENKSFEMESMATREDRHNRLLDHLLARFGEVFSDYTAQLALYCKDSKGSGYYESFGNFLRSKIDFLQELPILGYARGKAYDYSGGKEKKVWNSPNVPGIKKRVHRLLGLKGNWTQQSLLTTPAYRLDWEVVKGKAGGNQYQIVFRILPENLPSDAEIPTSKILLRSPKYTSLKATQEQRDALNSDIWNKDLFSIGEHPREKGRQTVIFSLDGKTELFGLPMGQVEAEALLNYIQELVAFEPDTDKEGFHVLEHILLRPNDADDHLLAITLGCTSQYTPNDPYSNWLTVVAPNWVDKSKNKTFQEHFEQTFRREMPAEMTVRFCWFDKETMREFEERYKAWLKAKATCTPDECHVTETANALIDWLNETPCSCSCTHCCDNEEACLECRECNNEQMKLKDYAG